VPAAAALLIGMLTGALLARPALENAAHRDGACIALDMAMAHGYLDATTRKVVTRALTRDINPYANRFPGGHRPLTDACAEIAKNRWNGW
jgi:hypothetical protein